MSSAIEPVELGPYPAYRESGLPWIGEVPEHWEVRRFGTLAAGFRNGLAVPQLESGVTAHLVSRIETISEGIVDYAKVGYLTGEEDHSPYLLRTDDFLISHINSYAKVGNSARYGGERPLIHGMNLIRVTPLNSVAPAFLGYMLKSELFRGAMQRVCKPAINQVSVTTTAIKAIYFPFPPFHEQAAIVRYLDDADQRIQAYVSAKETLIALLEEERQAIIHQAVTRGLTPNVKLKPSGVEWLGDVPEHWEVIPIKFLCRRIQNGATPPTDVARYYEDGEIPWYGPSSWTSQGELSPPVRNLSTTAFSEGKARLIYEPALLIVVIGATSGRMGLLMQDASTNQQITAFELDATKIHPSFLFHQVQHAEDWLRLTAPSSTLPILDSHTIARLGTAVPSVVEQVAIADHVSDATHDISLDISRARRQIKLMEEYSTRLIADVVTGKMDVREKHIQTDYGTNHSA